MKEPEEETPVRGRPRKPNKLIVLTCAIPPEWRDALDRRARREGKTTSEVVRDLLRPLFDTKKTQWGQPGPTL